jgi:DNA-binding NarL/FixJ family response regulator
MKRKIVFILEKETSVANLIRYQMLSHQVKQVQVFPSVSECLYFMEKKTVPDFLIADLGNPDINASDFLKSTRSAFPGLRVLFLSPHADDSLINRLMEEGASDCINTSGRMEDWIRELVKNMEFLNRETVQSN